MSTAPPRGRSRPPHSSPAFERSAARVIYAFDGFELDPGQGRLFRRGVPIQIDPRPLALVETLARNPDRVVAKDEILARVWPDAVVSDAALRSCVRHARRALGDLGQGAPIIATVRGEGYRLARPVSERRMHPRMNGASRGRLPFVGRDGVVEACWRQLRDGGGLLLVAGEPGIGKSRLLAELAEQAPAGDARALALRASTRGDLPPLWPWLDGLRELGRDDPELLARCTSGLEAAVAASLSPWIAPDSDPTPPEREVSRFERFDALAEVLRRVAADAPLLLLFDDLQDADRDSLDLLLHVFDQLRGAPALVVATVRDRDRAENAALERVLSELARSDRAGELPLRGLERDAFAQLLDGHELGLRPEEVELLQQRTGGNPLFLRELLADPSGDPLRALPTRVLELIREHLKALPALARGVLEPLALIAAPASPAVLARVSGHSRAETEAALEDARRVGVGIEYTGEEVGFDHALHAEALVAELSPARRAALAGRLGEALEAQLGGAPGSRTPLLARLFDEASKAAHAPVAHQEKAARYGAAAGDLAVAMAAWEDGAARYERALAHFPAAGLSGTRLHGETLLALAQARHRCRRVASAREAARQASDVARAIGDAHLLADAVLHGVHTGQGDTEWIGRIEEALDALGDASPAHRVRLLGRLAALLQYEGERERVEALAQQALDEAARMGDEQLLADARMMASWASLHPDGLARRRALLRQAIAVFDRAHPMHAHIGRFYLLASELEAGEMASADRLRAELVSRQRQLGLLGQHDRTTACTRALLAGRYEEAEELLRRAGGVVDPEEPNLIVFAGTMLAELRFQQGRLDELADLRAVVAGQGRGYLDVPAVRAFFALVDLESGRADEARAELDGLGERDFADLPEDFHRLAALSYLAELAFGLGDGDRAAQVYDRLAPYAERNVVFNIGILCRGSAAHYLGLAAETFGDLELAAQYYEEGLEANARWGAVPYVAHGRQRLGALLQRRQGPGDGPRAEALLAGARADAARLGMGLLLARAR